jgi:hypothetical protein
MDSQKGHDVTELLARFAEASGMRKRCSPLVDDEIRHIAARQIRREGPGHSLQATALLHGANARLINERAES